MTSRKTNARAARVYKDRRVALVDVCAIVGSIEDVEESATNDGFRPALRGTWATNVGFVTVLVAVGIG